MKDLMTKARANITLWSCSRVKFIELSLLKEPILKQIHRGVHRFGSTYDSTRSNYIGLSFLSVLQVKHDPTQLRPDQIRVG